jgi:PBP1b-binding outer membrane lipoprotein LpoB
MKKTISFLILLIILISSCNQGKADDVKEIEKSQKSKSIL